MKAIRTHGPAGISGLVFAEAPDAAPMIGDVLVEVFGLTNPYRDAAAAEYVAVEARNLAPKPRTADHVPTAAVPRAGLMAWQALFDHVSLTKGQTVVIHGAGGAVGSTAVQLARWAGAEVIGTGRSRARQLVMELGADPSPRSTRTGSRTRPARPTWCSTWSAAPPAFAIGTPCVRDLDH